MKRQMLDGQQAQPNQADVGRAAGAAEPGLARMLAGGLQRVGVEETVPFQRDAADEAIVQRALEHVIVLGVAVQEEHPVVHIHIADGGAGLAVGGHVREFVVLPEGLAHIRRADAAGDIQLLGNDVLPDAVDRVDVAPVAREGGHVRHAGVHVSCADSVAHGLVLFQHRNMRLVVRVVVAGLSALVQEELGLIQELLLAGGEVQLRKGHFRNLVAGNHAGLARAGAHFTDDAVRIADGDVQEVAFAGGLPVRHGPLHHVAEVVELVTQLLVVHPAPITRPFVRMLRVHRPGRVQVAVRLLGRRDDGEHAVDIGLQLLVRIGLEHVGGAFDGFVDIRVIERKSLHLVPEVHRRMHLLLRLHEVLIPPFALALGECQGYRDFAGRLQALPPERVRGHLHAGEGNGVDGIAARSGLRREGGGGEKADKRDKQFSGHGMVLYCSPFRTFRRR